MKPLLLKFILLLFFFSFNSNAQLISKKEFRLKDSKPSLIELNKNYDLTSKSSIAKNNSPFLAGSLSFIVPGAALGQLYNGQYLNFGIRLGISAISFIGIAAIVLPVGEGNGNDVFVPLAILYVANWITSIVDAVIFNKKHLSGK
jgi:hypothetical protein